jgi:hypothetical protein
MDRLKQPPTVALRCVFRITDEEGISRKFDQILILCDERLVNGMANFNGWGDEWRPHLGELFLPLLPVGR